MRNVTLRGLLAHKLRLGLTILAITLGVALVAGTFTLTGAMAADSAGPATTRQPDLVVRGQPLDALAGLPPDQLVPRQAMDAVVADRVAAVDGVTAVRGVVRGPVTVLDEDGTPAQAGGDATRGISITDVSGLRPPVELSDGELPTRDHAVLDAPTARELDLTVGDRVRVAGADGRGRAFTLGGILRPGGQPGGVVGFDLPTAQHLLGRADKLDEIQVAAAPGADLAALRGQVSAAAGRGVDVDTGAAVQRQQQAQRERSVRSVSQTMVWFVLVALLIGGFLVANAFSIMIAQRTRELALLRCLGATTRQVRNAVLLEALVIGLAASVLGTLLGPVVAAALAQQFSRLGGGLSADAGLSGLGNFLTALSPLAAVGSLAVGVLVTVVSALLPARKATAVPPLTAMRAESSGSAVERTSRVRVVTGLVITVAGGVVMAFGLARYAGALVGGGGLVFLVGAAVLAVPVARPLARLIGAPVARLGGMPGRLGRANAMRSPRRTAATAAALMIGLAMIVTMTVIAGSQQATALAAARTLGADYQVAAGRQPADADPFGTADGPAVSRALLDELSAQPRVTGVTGKWSLEAALATPRGWKGTAPAVPVDAVYDPAAYQRITDLRVEAGRMDGRGFAVSDTFADSLGVSRGSHLWLDIPGAAANGAPVVLPVTGVFHDPEHRASPIVVAIDQVAGALPSAGVPVAAVEVDGGPSPTAAAALASAASPYPAAAVRGPAEQQRFQQRQINQVLYLMYALLGLAVVIGLLGVVNTLALSMVDRVRELGLLRALGMDRGQVRTMIRGEAMIIALLGALLGLAIGLLFGWAVASRLMRLTVFAVPVAQLAALVAAAAIASLAAAVLPGRWAARIDVLRAVSSE